MTPRLSLRASGMARWGQRVGLSTGLWSLVAWTVLACAAVYLGLTAHGDDARVYWEASNAAGMYDASTITASTLMYSPAFVFWTEPLRWLPWPVFHLLIVVLEVLALAWLVGPLWGAVLLLVPVVYFELASANLNLIAGALLVLALSRPALWSPLTLTKVTPAVGGLWHLFRGEWRAVGIAVGVTALLVAPTLLWPWGEWFAQLVASSGERSFWPIPFAVRAVVAICVVWYAARSDRPWLVPLAAALAIGSTVEGLLIGLGAIRCYAPSR